MSARLSASQFYECLQSPLTLVTMRRIFLLMSRVHWADPENHGEAEDDLKCLVYSDDPAVSNLTVALQHVYDVNKTDNFPGVFVGFKGVNYTKSGINYFAEESDDRSSTYYTALASTIMCISHVHSSADTALLMAESSTAFFMGIREPMARRLGVRGWDINQLGDTTKITEEPSRFFKVDLLMTLSFNHTLTVNLESHRLKKYGLEFNPEPR